MKHRGLFNLYLQNNKDYSQAFVNRYGEFIVKSTNIIFGVNKNEFYSNKRWAHMVMARKVVTNMLTHYYNLHPTVIGEWIGKDRSTIIHNGKKHADWHRYHNEYKEAFNTFVEFVSDIIDADDLKDVMATTVLEKSKDEMIDYLRKEIFLLKQKLKDGNKITN